MQSLEVPKEAEELEPKASQLDNEYLAKNWNELSKTEKFKLLENSSNRSIAEVFDYCNIW